MIADRVHFPEFSPFGGDRLGDRFFDQPLPGAELAVKTTMGHAGGFGQRIDTDAGNPALADQPRGRRKNAFAVVGRFFLGNTYVEGPESVGLDNYITIIISLKLTIVIEMARTRRRS